MCVCVSFSPSHSHSPPPPAFFQSRLAWLLPQASLHPHSHPAPLIPLCRCSSDSNWVASFSFKLFPYQGPKIMQHGKNTIFLFRWVQHVIIHAAGFCFLYIWTLTAVYLQAGTKWIPWEVSEEEQACDSCQFQHLLCQPPSWRGVWSQTPSPSLS